MRNMSFSMTWPAILDRTKTVTRRRPDTWRNLKEGDRLQSIQKGMGLKKGETVERGPVIEVVSIRVEQLDSITVADVRREGFKCDSRYWFLAMMHRELGLCSVADIRRIEFRYVAAA